MFKGMIQFRRSSFASWLAWICLCPLIVTAQDSKQDINFSDSDIQFFATKVRPILNDHCMACHGSDPDELQGGLALISRRSILNGGDSGPAVDLEEHSESILLNAINYDSYEMPPSGKLKDEQIEILTRWVKKGMPWPAVEAERVIEPKT